MRIGFLLTLCAALLLGAGCGGDDGEDVGEESLRDFTLAEIVARPPAPGETVGVTGEAKVLEEVGFQLSDDQNNAILVLGGEDQVQDGEQVRVVGDVQRISQSLSTTIANRLEGTPDVVARTNSGAVYLDFERLAPPEAPAP